MSGQSMAMVGKDGAETAGWLFLSDVLRAPPRAEGRLHRGLLVMELAWPLASDVLLDWQDDAGRALSLFHDGGRGLILLWREGARLTRHLLPGPLWAEGRLARLHLGWDLAHDLWTLRLDDGTERVIASTCGTAPAGFPLAALAALCAGQGVARRDPSVLWFGVTAGDRPPRRRPWIGRATPVPTPAGDVPAALLKPGEWVLTRDAGPLRLQAVHHLRMPGRGSHAPVVLRAPYFARGQDLLVSADQPVALSGAEVEYLFDEDEVLVAAGALADGRSALPDNRRATTACVSLDLGAPHLIDCGGCLLMTAPGPALPPLRLLMDYEALPLMDLLRRMRPADAA
ncbi:Hint domain-containing protein [Neotabrizicola sp. VNH66]|uniref:Hint domain-containing protein n=1 Tax=Neotabrizicola sp. VNH66 TaxID=3400918 RepID=UPI003C037C04